MTLYRQLMVTFALSSTVSEIWQVSYAFPYPTPIWTKIWGVPFGVDQWCWHCWVCREQSLYANQSWFFEVFQPMWPRFLNVTDGPADGRTDRRFAMAIPRSYHIWRVEGWVHGWSLSLVPAHLWRSHSLLLGMLCRATAVRFSNIKLSVWWNTALDASDLCIGVHHCIGPTRTLCRFLGVGMG